MAQLARISVIVPQPRAQLMAPTWPILVDSELLRHSFAGFGEKRSRSFVSNLGQWRKIAANCENDSASSRKASQSVMFCTQERRVWIDIGGFGWTIVTFAGVGAIERQIECVLVDLYSPLLNFRQSLYFS